MTRDKRALLCLVWTLVAGCGGGGGGDGDGGSADGTSPARPQADLKGSNASVFAEVFRLFLAGEIAALDEAVMGFGGDVPVLTLTNTTQTMTCDAGGSVTITVAGNGADITFQYQSCIEGETPYHGSYQIQGPIVMSPDDQYVMLGSGDIYKASDLTWYRSLVNDYVAAIWDGNGTITALESIGGATRIHRYNANQVWQSEENRAGAPLALLEHAGGYLLVTHDGTKPAFAALAR